MIIGVFPYISMFNFVPTLNSLNFPACQIFLIYSTQKMSPHGMDITDVAGITDVTDVAGFTDVAGVTDVMGVT